MKIKKENLVNRNVCNYKHKEQNTETPETVHPELTDQKKLLFKC